MKKLFFVFSILMTLAMVDVQAQFSNLWISDFTVDTLTNTDTGEFTFSKNFDYASTITFLVQNEEVSGSASNVLTLQQNPTSNVSTAWVTTDTIGTATATTDYTYSLTAMPQLSTDKHLWGYRIRMKAATSGTGVHRVKVYAIARRINKP